MRLSAPVRRSGLPRVDQGADDQRETQVDILHGECCTACLACWPCMPVRWGRRAVCGSRGRRPPPSGFTRQAAGGGGRVPFLPSLPPECTPRDGHCINNPTLPHEHASPREAPHACPHLAFPPQEFPSLHATVLKWTQLPAGLLSNGPATMCLMVESGSACEQPAGLCPRCVCLCRGRGKGGGHARQGARCASAGASHWGGPRRSSNDDGYVGLRRRRQQQQQQGRRPVAVPRRTLGCI
jgi:hypothetical protein